MPISDNKLYTINNNNYILLITTLIFLSNKNIEIISNLIFKNNEVYIVYTRNEYKRIHTHTHVCAWFDTHGISLEKNNLQRFTNFLRFYSEICERDRYFIYVSTVFILNIFKLYFLIVFAFLTSFNNISVTLVFHEDCHTLGKIYEIIIV